MLPSPLKLLLNDLSEQDTCSTEACKTCEGYKHNHCCTRPGFQTLENTIMIYDKFYSSISYKSFIDKYYETPKLLYNGSMIIFYPKVNKAPSDKVSNGGCVFLKNVLDGTPGEQFKNCSLYDPYTYSNITTFPLGCVTDSGTSDYDEYYRFDEYRLSMINYFYFNSTKRFDDKYRAT